MRYRVYISGPITKGDRIHNFNQACVAQEQLMLAEFAPLNPMLSMMHPAAWTISHEHWLASDIPWVRMADAVLRLPGESTGADEETRYAMSWFIPVFYSIEELLAWRQTQLVKDNMNQERSAMPVSSELTSFLETSLTP